MSFCPSCGASIEKDKDTYCPFCGAPTITEKKEEKLADDFPAEPAKPIESMQPIAAPGTITPVTSYPATTTTQSSQTAPQLEIRSFWMWTLLGLVTFGIASYVYMYYNIQDLDKLSQHPAPAGVKSTHIDTSNLTILIIVGLITGLIGVLMLIGTFLKFQKLHEYINSHPQRQQTIPISGARYLITSIIGSCVISIIPIAMAIPMAFEMMDETMYLIISAVLYGVMGIGCLIFGIYMLIQQANWQKAYNERARMLCPGTPEKSL